MSGLNPTPSPSTDHPNILLGQLEAKVAELELLSAQVAETAERLKDAVHADPAFWDGRNVYGDRARVIDDSLCRIHGGNVPNDTRDQLALLERALSDVGSLVPEYTSLVWPD